MNLVVRRARLILAVGCFSIRGRRTKVRHKLNHKQLQSTPDRKAEIWNAFLDLLCLTDYADLAPNQRVAQLALFYDNEVGNGGHLQYFENQGTGRLQETLAALETIGADCQRQILESASRKALANPRPKVDNLQQYHERALESEYNDHDATYYECRPEIVELLESYLEARLEEFI